MRILVSLRPFYGHLHPLAPTARALRDAGHDVVLAAAPPFRSAVEAEGLRFTPAGRDPRAPLPTDEGGASARDWGEVATRTKLDDVLDLARRWRPDVVLREQTDFAALLAAEVLDVPPATLGPALYIPTNSWQKLQGDRLDRIRADFGIAPDPAFERLHPFLYLDVVPPSWQHPLVTQVETVLHRVRPVAAHEASARSAPETERPLAFVTLGTVYNRRPVLLRSLVEGAVDAGFYVVAAAGPDAEPANDTAEHAEIHRWLPQLEVIATSRVVLAHGGFSTVMGALAHAVPLVVVPLGSDNHVHARRCREHGVGIVIGPADADRAAARDAATRLLVEPSWRRNARRLRAEIATLPAAEHAAELVVRLGAERAPLESRRRRRVRPRRGRTAAIVPSFGSFALAHALLGDIGREDWVEPVIVDNDGDYLPLDRERVLRPGSNLGWAGGCNHALRELADDGYGAFVLLNSDTRLSRDFFAGLWDAYRQTGARVVGPVYDGVWPYQHADHDGEAADYRPRRLHRDVPFLDGTCLFVPAETVRELGALDAESFPRHGWGVDFDYALRVRAGGGRIVATELSYLHHEGNATARLQPDGWQVGAWDELVSGMRRKWGQAWPSRLRGPDAGPPAEADEPERRSANTCVVVAGAPRSGASLVTRLVNVLGVAPPSPAAERELGRLSAELTGGADWLPPAAPFDLLAPASAVDALDEARRALAELVPRRPWLWRDPRNDFLLPFWAAALDVDPVVVLVLRDPVEVADSLHARLGWSVGKALAYWERSVRHALLNAIGLPVLVTRFEDVLEDPVRWCAHAEAFLAGAGLPLLVPSDRRVVSDTVQQQLRRHRRLDSATGAVLSDEQQRLAACADGLVGLHRSFPEVELPPETPTADEDLRRAPGSTNGGHADGVPSRLTEEWAAWVLDNRRLGVHDAQLVQVIVEQGISAATARREVERLGNGWSEPGYRMVNRSRWNELVEIGATYTVPYGPYELAWAREILDEPLRLPWEEVETVLCLASGGGQQAPLFAALGKRVTLVDLSPAQLERDRESARLYRLEIECIEGDMLDLGKLHGREFDLVYQPVSTCYVDDVRRVYGEVAAVLRPGGWYWSEHWNPVHMQLEELGRWSGRGYRIVRPQQQSGPVIFTDENGEEGPGTCWHFVHSLSELVGTLGTEGFAVEGFAERYRGDAGAEPGSDDHVCAFTPPLLTVLARQSQVAGKA